MSDYKKLAAIPKEELAKIFAEETSKLNVLRRLGINPKHGKCGKYLRRFVVEHDIDITHMQSSQGLQYRYTKEQVSEWVNNSICWSDVIRTSGREFYGNMIGPIKRLVGFYDINTDHFDSKLAAVKNHRANTTNTPTDEIFSEHSKISRGSLKRYIIANDIIPYVCKKCSNTGEWMGEPLVLQIEHINGIRDDHRLENLCFLCGNCHSQTPTYAGRNWKKAQREVLPTIP